MKKRVCVVLPKSFEDYDDLEEFMDDAKVFIDPDQAMAEWGKSKGLIFALDVADRP